MTEAEAVGLGFTIDRGQRAIGYKGPRFTPTETVEIKTEEADQRDLAMDALRQMLVHVGMIRKDAEPNGPELLLFAETWIEGREPTGAIVELAYHAKPVAGSGTYCRAEIIANATCGIAGRQEAVVAEVVDHGNPNPGIYFCKTTPLSLAEKIAQCVRENLP